MWGYVLLGAGALWLVSLVILIGCIRGAHPDPYQRLSED